MRLETEGGASRHGNRRLLGFAVASQMAAWTGAALFIPTIPLYLRHLNASDVEIGYYSAATLISLSFGPMFLGWLSDRLHVRDRLVVACLALQVPTAYAMGLTDSLVLTCLLNVCLWTFGASSINLTRAIVALNYSEGERNQAFAKLAITSPISFVIGGFAGGRIVEAWGYPGLFTVMTGFWFLAAIFAMGIQDRYCPEEHVSDTDASVSRPLILFCVAMALQSLAFQWSEIGMPLRLEELEFSLPFITSMYSVSSLVSIPFVLLAGRYATRLGNVRMLTAGLAIFAITRVVLSVVGSGGAILATQMVTGIPVSSVHSIAAALMAGLGPDRSVGRRMSLLMMCSGVGGGHILSAFGPDGLLVCAAVGLGCSGLFMGLFVTDPERVGRERVRAA